MQFCGGLLGTLPNNPIFFLKFTCREIHKRISRFLRLTLQEYFISVFAAHHWLAGHYLRRGAFFGLYLHQECRSMKPYTSAREQWSNSSFLFLPFKVFYISYCIERLLLTFTRSLLLL